MNRAMKANDRPSRAAFAAAFASAVLGLACSGAESDTATAMGTSSAELRSTAELEQRDACELSVPLLYVEAGRGEVMRMTEPKLDDLAAVGVEPTSCCMLDAGCIDLPYDLCIGTLASVCAVKGWVPYCNPHECWCVDPYED